MCNTPRDNTLSNNGVGSCINERAKTARVSLDPADIFDGDAFDILNIGEGILDDLGAAGIVGNDYRRQQGDKTKRHIVALKAVDLGSLGERGLKLLLELIKIDLRALRHDLHPGGDLPHRYGPRNPQSGH